MLRDDTSQLDFGLRLVQDLAILSDQIDLSFWRLFEEIETAFQLQRREGYS